MSDLYSDLIDLKQDLIAIREDLGDPRLRSLTFETPTGLVIITPRLTVSIVPPKMVGLPLDSQSNFTIDADDLYVKNVSRNYDIQIFKYRCWLDAVIVSGVITEGTSTRVLKIEDSRGLSYNLVLRKEGEQTRL